MAEMANRMVRRKSQGTWFVEGPLDRCMNIFDLTVLGLGGLIDAGIYVVIGQLALTLAGPAVIISFLIAAVAAVLSGLCYAELSSRITKTGSAYVFTYVILGEVWAFLAGWSMIAEYIVNAASTARAITGYINSFTNGAMFDLFQDKLGWGDELSIFGRFPNFPALGLVIFSAVIVGVGVRESKTFMDAITSINGAALISSLVAGIALSNPDNWSTMEKFAPHGWSGILMAAPSCFYCLSGFDAVPTASEEALDPRRDVPKAIMLSIGIATIAYIGVIITMTLMVPSSQLTPYAPLAEAFWSRGFTPGYYIVSVGGICAIFGSLLATIYAVTRLFYSIAYDGLISTCMAKVGQNRHVPTRAVLCTAVLTGTLACCIEMSLLVELVSVATIATYTMVSLCVILSRYQTDISSVYLDGYVHSKSVSDWLQNRFFPKGKKKGKAWENYERISMETGESDVSVGNTPSNLTYDTQLHAIIALVFIILCLLGFWTCFDLLIQDNEKVDPYIVSFLSIHGVIVVIATVYLFQLPRNNVHFPFMIPMAVPVLSIVINTFILVRINWMSYLMFCTWVATGMVIYLAYSFTHSTESLSEGDGSVIDFAVIPIPLPTGTEVIRPIQGQRNPLANFSDYDPDEWENNEY